MTDFQNVLRATAVDQDDQTLYVTTYARRVYTTKNGWMSVVPFYRVYERIERDDNGGIINIEQEGTEGINDDRKRLSLRRNKRVPWVYHDVRDTRHIMWAQLDNAHTDGDTEAKQIADEKYTCSKCTRYAPWGHVQLHHALCRHCRKLML